MVNDSEGKNNCKLMLFRCLESLLLEHIETGGWTRNLTKNKEAAVVFCFLSLFFQNFVSHKKLTIQYTCI